MRKKLVVGCIILSVTGAADAACTAYGTTPNNATTSGDWVAATTISKSAAEQTALTWCQDQYCAVHIPVASLPGNITSAVAAAYTTKAMLCSDVRKSAQVTTNLTTANDAYWCCLAARTKATIEAETSGGTEETPQTYPIVACPAGMSHYQCTTFCKNTVSGTSYVGGATVLPAGVTCEEQFAGVTIPSALKGRYCCTTTEATSVADKNTCPDNQIPYGNWSYTVSSTVTNQTISGNTVAITSMTTKVPATYPVCICKPDYYGAVESATTAASSNCTKCPCVTSIDGATLTTEVCGKTYDIITNAMIQAVMQQYGGSIPQSLCKISCDGSSCKAKDNTGTWHYTDECTY